MSDNSPQERPFLAPGPRYYIPSAAKIDALRGSRDSVAGNASQFFEALMSTNAVPDELALLVGAWKQLAERIARGESLGSRRSQDTIHFAALTAQLISLVNSHCPKLDPSPLLDLAATDADSPPSRDAKAKLLDKALIVVEATVRTLVSEPSPERLGCVPTGVTGAINSPTGPSTTPELPSWGTREAMTPPASTKSKRRGRTAGVDRIGEAIAALGRRLKDGESTNATEIAKEVKCTAKNLKRSKRFQDAYRELTHGMKRALRHRGHKKDGNLDAWPGPRGDREEDEGDF
jgi:hypothetical protein